MPSILVVEQEPDYADRIHAALGAEGWRVRVVPSVDQALQAAAAESPDLVMAGTDAPGFEVLAFSFSRRAGGPGLLGVAPEQASGPAPAAADGADAHLAKPFNDQQMVLAARQALLARRPPAGAAAATAAPEHKLTSHDIFGDVLAEVEGDQVPRPVIAPPRQAAPPPPPVAPAPPRPAPQGAGEDVQRRLEKTLSGMLTPEPRPRPAPAQAPPPRRAEPAGDNVDALLSRTLSNLDLGKTKTGVRPAPPAPASAAPPAAPSEGTGVRKGRAVGDFDFAELEELARPTRPAAPPPARPTPAPVAPPPPPPAAAPVAPPAAPRAVAPPPPLVFTPPPEPVPTGASVLPGLADLADAAATQRIPIFAAEAAEAPGEAGERFGQYTLLERIAIGGMAEVWKARMRGVEGFQKTVAIKRILPHMTDNAEFVGMFIDEAKLAAQLTHPNIVHIYDLGKIGRDYYIAMEYVDGKDLRSLLNAGRRKGLPLPLGLGLLIAARIASALDYAHRKRDFEDRELGLVHRDVSPQNVLLTADGDVKLCDFGIAKAVSKASQTQMGALKGKLQYMSPEQAWGRAVDARSDLFSLGAVLFEMVTGERLFTGDSEISVLDAVRQGRIRTPRQLDPSVPREVDDIVARALAVDPQDRFQSAGEMKQRLEAALAALAPSPGPADLAAYIQRVLDPSTPDVAERSEPAAPVPPPAAPALPPPPVAMPVAAAPVPSSVAQPFEAVAPLGEVAVEGEGERKSRTRLYVAIAALIVIAIVTFFVLSRRKGAAPTPVPSPAAATVPGTPGGPPVPAANPSPGPAAVSQTAPATLPTAQAPGKPVDFKAMMDQQLAAKEEELRKKNEAKLKELEKQVAAAKAAGQPAPAGASSGKIPLAPAAAQEPVPAPKPAVQEPAPPPEPAKVEEKATEPAKREPEPAPPASRTKVGELVEGGTGVAPPQLVSFPKPGYPPMARTLRVEGTVVVAVLVDENGQVQEVRMAEPMKQNVGLNEVALSSARSARYKPATKDGVRVKMWTRLKIPFKL